MLSLITSYLLQTNKCALPYIGIFNTEYVPAVNDIVNSQLLPPAEEIFFKEETMLLSPGLISYIARQKNITDAEAGTLLDDFCKDWKDKIDSGETLCFDSFGRLHKNDSGNISFTGEQYSPAYYEPVNVIKVRPENDQVVLADDTLATPVPPDMFAMEEVVIEKKRWQVAALVLAIIAIITLIFSFYNHRLSVSTTGNRNHFTIKAAGETYFKISK